VSTAISEQRPGQRAWRDLSKWRLLAGLAFAPMPPMALGSIILLMLGANLIFTFLSPVLAAAEIWSMIGGTVFLLLARLGGTVRRAHCLLLGTFLAFSLPYVGFLVGEAVDSILGPEPSADVLFLLRSPSLGFSLVLGLILSPFGALGGWVFWRVGVYPARSKLVDVAPVFD